MKIGIPKEIKNNENRVALTPNGVQVLVSAGHSVYVEDSAGLGSNFTNEEYENAGAILVDAEKAWSQELVIKVKEPLESEYQFFRKDLILFTYLHLAPVPELTDAIVNSGMTAIAYETMIKDGKLPLLTPMSEVAGRMAVQIGAQFLEKQAGGKGVLLGAVPGVPKGHVVVIGGGISGTNAAKMAYGLGADVTILDVQAKRLSELDDLFGGNGIQTLMSNSANIAEVVKDADLIIGAVLIPGRKAPVLVTEVMVASMEPGTVIVDIAIDQGGIFETTGKTMGTLDNPTFVKHDVVHYAVPNMPGAVPRTSTIALTNASLPYATEIANKGVIQAIKDNSTIWSGVNAYAGKLTNQGVAEDQSKSYTDLADLL